MPSLGVNGSVEFKKGSERVYIEFEDKESCVAYEMDYEINSKEKEDIDVPLICELINLASDEHREPELEDTKHVEVKRCALDFFETFVVACSLQYVDFPDKTDMEQYVEFSGKVV